MTLKAKRLTLPVCILLLIINLLAPCDFVDGPVKPDPQKPELPTTSPPRNLLIIRELSSLMLRTGSQKTVVSNDYPPVRC